ncbi:DNA cytosine methyltransferase [Zavarzinella formosa]|uniref:DNA cytosine methyltransferase n=1 Tax=Zavarzinella formosa TaxID=360055 RepID=UPI0002F33AC7|nr:DNA cytosine methyltransferase [Zavarzinella formosa]
MKHLPMTRATYPVTVKHAQSVLQKMRPGSSGRPRQTTIQVLDFFCGCGGMSAGFAAAGVFRVLGGVDINADALATFDRNINGRGMIRDIRELEADPAKLDELLADVGYDPSKPLVLIGCAPCQGFSSHRKKHWGVEDRRNSLVAVFCQIAARLNPVAVVMENVPEMLSLKYWDDFTAGRQTLEQAGYVVRQQIYNLAAFGVPQQRFRSLVLAMRRDFSLPRPLLEPDDYRTVRDAIGELPSVMAGETDPADPMHRSATHRASTLETIRAVPKNGGSRPAGVGPACLDQVRGFYDVYGRLSWDQPSITITHYARNPASGRYVHPEQDRGLTIREAAILQGFPRGFEFHGTFDAVFKQIGEAVPPMFSAAVAAHLAIELSSPPRSEAERLADEIPSIESPVSSSFSSVIAGLKNGGRARGVYLR